MASWSPLRSRGPNVKQMMKINMVLINANQEIKYLSNQKTLFKCWTGYKCGIFINWEELSTLVHDNFERSWENHKDTNKQDRKMSEEIIWFIIPS